MVDIKQYTNFSDLPSSETKTINIITPTGTKTLNVLYKIVTIENQIVKLGYCCGDSFHQLPIYINNLPYQIGKTGMLEYQREYEGEEPIELADFSSGGTFAFPCQNDQIGDITWTFDYATISS